MAGGLVQRHPLTSLVAGGKSTPSDDGGIADLGAGGVVVCDLAGQRPAARGAAFELLSDAPVQVSTARPRQAFENGVANQGVNEPQRSGVMFSNEVDCERLVEGVDDR